MSILARLALLFVIVPLVELALLIRVGQAVGFWPTIGLVAFTGVAGAWLARLEGLRTMFKLRDDLARGRLPGQAIMDGMAVLLGGALLLTPGIVTDVLGFSLLLPQTRRSIQRRVRARLEARLEEHVRSGAIHMTMMDNSVWANPTSSGVEESPTEGEQYREAVYREEPQREDPSREDPSREGP